MLTPPATSTIGPIPATDGHVSSRRLEGKTRICLVQGQRARSAFSIIDPVLSASVLVMHCTNPGTSSNSEISSFLTYCGQAGARPPCTNKVYGRTSYVVTASLRVNDVQGIRKLLDGVPDGLVSSSHTQY